MKTISERLKAYIAFKNISQRDFGESIGKSGGWVNNAGKSLKTETSDLIRLNYPDLNIDWVISGIGEMIIKPEPNNLPDPMQQLAKIKSNGKPKNAKEGRVVDEEELVPVKTYIIPIKGFAGLRKHFFADEYITENFEETVTYVPKYERVSKLLKIQADGNSMPPLIAPGDFCNCEPIQDITIDYKFKPEKIYCFFHHSRGIVFKRAKNLPFGQIELSSDNPDKIEYPNEKFDIGEFKKILIVREIIKKV